MTTTTAHQRRGLLLSLLTLLILAGATFVSPFDASASTRVAAETRVRAIDTPTTAFVGRVDAASSTIVEVSEVPLRQQASATGVATEAAGGLGDDFTRALDDIDNGITNPNVRNPKPFSNDGPSLSDLG